MTTRMALATVTIRSRVVRIPMPDWCQSPAIAMTGMSLSIQARLKSVMKSITIVTVRMRSRFTCTSMPTVMGMATRTIRKRLVMLHPDTWGWRLVTPEDIHPGVDEYCNGTDDDCDGDVDEDESVDVLLGTWTTMAMDMETLRAPISTAISPLVTSRIVRTGAARWFPIPGRR